MSEYKDKLTKMEKVIQDRKLEKAKLEERLKTLEEEEKAVLEQLKGSGIEDVFKLPLWIDEQKKEIETKLAELAKTLGV